MIRFIDPIFNRALDTKRGMRLMARLNLKAGVTMKALGAEIHRLATDDTAYAEMLANPTGHFAQFLDLGPGQEIVAIRDTDLLKHIVIPFYGDDGPQAGAEEIAGATIIMGCGE
jgi:hypothetical protein